MAEALIGNGTGRGLVARPSLCGRETLAEAAAPSGEAWNGDASPSGIEGLGARIRELAALEPPPAASARAVVEELFLRLEAGEVRAAERTAAGWRANAWVKSGISLAFRIGQVIEFASTGPLAFSDRETLGPRHPPAGARVVPGGSAIRRGAHLGRDVVVMPQAYVDVGVYVGTGSRVDSHALVGSCAQIGARVHLSAGAQIGGVLEPDGPRPVVVEDDAFVGPLVGIFEGVVVGRGAVLSAGVILTAGSELYDLPRSTVHRGSREEPLVVPEGAVVVAGSRPAAGGFAAEHGIAITTPILVRYRNPRADAATALATALR